MRADIKITYEDYLSLPDGGPRYQLIEGELFMSPSPSFRHQAISGRLFAALNTYVQQNGCGITAYAPLDVVLSDENVCQPDVLYISKANSSIIKDEGVFGPPDLCIEILSPHKPQLDLKAKRSVYAKYGVTEYWIVDPDKNTVMQYRLQEDAERPRHLLDQNAILTSVLLPGFELNLARLFAK
jgi:Uma2 family endonuclease